MKKHKLVVELTTDNDEVAQLYYSVNSKGRLPELIENLIYLHIRGYYAKYNVAEGDSVNSVLSSESNNSVSNANNDEVVGLLQHLKEVVQDLQQTVKSATVPADLTAIAQMAPMLSQIVNTPTVNTAITNNSEVVETPGAEYDNSESVPVINTIKPKNKSGGRRDLSKFKKLKGG